MVREMKEILKELGWGEGFNLPVSNEENKKLENEIENLIKKKAEAIVKYEMSKDRLTGLQRQEKQLSEQKHTNQQLLVALRKNVDSEITMLRDNENEFSKKKYSIKKMDKEIAEASTRNNKIISELSKMQLELEEVKKTLAWEEQALFAWEEEMAKGDQFASMLRDLQYQDEDRFNELELKRQMLQSDLLYQQEIEQKEAHLLMQNEKMVLVHGKMFTEVNEERTKLILRWHQASKLLCHRDNQISFTLKEIDDTNRAARMNYFLMNDERTAFQNFHKENEILRKEIEDYSSKIAKAKSIKEELKQQIALLNLEIKQNEKVIYDLSVSLESLESTKKEIRDTIKGRHDKILCLESACAQFREKIDVLDLTKSTTDQKFRNSEDLFEIGQKVLKEEQMELERLQARKFKVDQDLLNLKSKIEVKSKEFGICEGNRNQLEKEATSLANELDSIHSELQHKEVELTIVNHKYAQLLEEDCVGLENKYDEHSKGMEDEIKQLRTDQATLRFQINQLKKEHKELVKQFDAGQKEQLTLDEKSVELKLMLKGGKKNVADFEEEYAQVLLDLNMMKMQAEEVKDSLKKEQEKLCSLERRKVVIEAALEERYMEIKSQKEILSSKKKVLQEERLALKKSIDHLNTRIKQLHNRYEIELDRFGKTEEGEQMSVAYCKIKLSQEKYELQEKGDELEAKINKTEKEIQAMENTLRLVSCTNENFKNNLESIDTDGPEMQEFERIECIYHELNSEARVQCKDVSGLDKEIATVKSNIAHLQKVLKEVEAEWKAKEQEVSELAKVLSSKQEKLTRATKILKKLMTEVMNNKQIRNCKLAMRDIEARVKNDLNDSVIQQLVEFATLYQEARPSVLRLSAENELHILLTGIRDNLVEIDEPATGGMDDFESVSSVPTSVLQMDPTLLIPDSYKIDYMKFLNKK